VAALHSRAAAGACQAASSSSAAAACDGTDHASVQQKTELHIDREIIVVIIIDW
jgi:hypothetical protein